MTNAKNSKAFVISHLDFIIPPERSEVRLVVGEHFVSVEVVLEKTVEDTEERMLAQVTASPMRYRTTESLRFPWQ